VEGSAVPTAALSNLSSEAVPDAPSLPNQALTPQPDFAMADCCTRLANKYQRCPVDQSANLDSSGVRLIVSPVAAVGIGDWGKPGDGQNDTFAQI
jgi:hypothetical protein